MDRSEGPARNISWATHSFKDKQPDLTMEDGVVKLPESAQEAVRRADDGLDRREVLHIETPHKPAPPRQPCEIRRRLQKPPEVSRLRRIRRSVVKRRQSARSRHQRPISSSRDGDGDPWKAGPDIGEIVNVAPRVEAADVGPAEDVFEGLDGVVCAEGEPVCFVAREARCCADGGPVCWA